MRKVYVCLKVYSSIFLHWSHKTQTQLESHSEDLVYFHLYKVSDGNLRVSGFQEMLLKLFSTECATEKKIGWATMRCCVVVARLVYGAV
jgi:hypothetical protein